MQPNSSLNCIVAFIQPFQLDAHPPHTGERAEVNPFRAAVRLELFCRAADAIGIVEAIQQAGRTGHPGDGKIFVGPVNAGPTDPDR